MQKKGKRGVPIGGYPSQPIANFTVSHIDHHMKEVLKCKCYLRYCNDTLGLARTKAEAWKMVNEYEKLSSECGLMVKASIIVAPIAKESHEKTRKRRRRQRGRGQKNRLSRICIQPKQCPTPEKCEA